MPHLFFSPHVCGEECNDNCTDAKREQGRFERIRKAKAVCRTCPVKPECLEWALANNVDHGVWGETTERDRKRIRQQRARSERA